MRRFWRDSSGFRRSIYSGDESLFARLRQGQNPRALVISCCDSRADPGMLLGAGPGDIFVVRNVANLVPPYRNGAEMPGIRADIEFAVKGLNVERIIILGHSGCGGIAALMEGEAVSGSKYEFIGAWVSIAQAAREQVLRELAGEPPAVQAKACEKAAIALSLQNLLYLSLDSRASGCGLADAAWLVLRHRRGRAAGAFSGDRAVRAAGGEGCKLGGQRSSSRRERQRMRDGWAGWRRA